MQIKIVIVLSILILALIGCNTSAKKVEAPTQGNKLTVGTVQKEIHKDLTQTQVLEILGSPNIVTSDSEDKETWVYDKFNHSVSYKKSSSYGTILLLGSENSSGENSYSQQTLTIIIKFNKGKVYEYKYHSSKF